MTFVEIWNIEPLQLETNYLSPLFAVGIAFIVFESLVVLSRKKWGEQSSLFSLLNRFSRPKYPYSLILFPIGVISIIIGIFIIKHSENKYHELITEIHSSKTEVVEGEITVNFKQPKEGHTDGDLIQIGNKTFEISTFFMSHFYHKAISNGGVLTKGKYVRIHFIPSKGWENDEFGDGKITQIEVKQ